MDYVKRIVKEDESPTLANMLHVAESDVTLCGKQLTPRWYVLQQCENSDVTCPKCRRQLITRNLI